MYAIAAYGVQCLAAGCRGQVQGSRVCIPLPGRSIHTLVAGCRGSGAGQQGVRPGRGMLHDWPYQEV